MSTAKQKTAARRNVTSAAAAARAKRTIEQLSKATRTTVRQAGGQGRE